MIGVLTPEEVPVEIPVLVRVALGTVDPPNYPSASSVVPTTSITQVVPKVYFVYAESHEEAAQAAIGLASDEFRNGLAFEARVLREGAQDAS